MKTFDVAIAGGGIIGASIAFELAAEKLKVVLLDRQQPGTEASWAAAGMLSPGPDSEEAIPLVPLGMESLRLYHEFITALEETSGLTTEFDRKGTLQVFSAPRAEADREWMIKEFRRANQKIEPLSEDAARKREKHLGPAVGVAAFLPEEATLDPRLLIKACLAAAERRGVEIRPGCEVDSVMEDAGRCTGIVAGTEKILAENVVVAAGSSSAGIPSLARYAPTRPVRGQMLALRSRDIRLERVVRSEKGYLVPRRDGRIIAGSTLEDAGFQRSITPGGMRQILDGVLELVPGLANAEIVETWSGLRPGTPDALPILGPTDVKGLFMATGHYRNGILLAPVTAKLLRNWIVDEKISVNTELFSPLRFSAALGGNEKRKGAATLP
ncbi:MAG TPA: glycine oxidase ThiO [Candidatus Limnocylindrales bacterium]|nr:glycine oxidase ThiO [Candidatus Limnocylindrales bacterium]